MFVFEMLIMDSIRVPIYTVYDSGVYQMKCIVIKGSSTAGVPKVLVFG